MISLGFVGSVATVTWHNLISQLNMKFPKFDADIQTFTIQKFESFEW